MSHAAWMRIMVVSTIICVMAFGPGCRRRPKSGADITPPTAVDIGEIPQSERFEDGQRVTDVTFENVLFDYDSYQIKPGESSKIDRVAEYMKANPRVRLVAEGHCDERGSREYNMALGEQRALAVRAHLIGSGIDAARIQTKSYGEERPVNPGHDESAWRLNRRVEFALYR